MTPSNPTNGQPLIYRIMDALGVSHLVACINHTHEHSEVEGLANVINKTSTIDVSDLPINQITAIRFLNTTDVSMNLYDIFSFDNVDTTDKVMIINAEDVIIPIGASVLVFILKKKTGLNTLTTLYVWYQGFDYVINKSSASAISE